MSADLVADHLREQLAWSRSPLPERWNPGVGGQLVGQLTAWDEGTTSSGDTFKIAIVRDKVGAFFSVALFWTVLRSEFLRTDPQVGETIAIDRLPDRTSRKGRRYLDFKMSVYREGISESTHNNTPPPIPPRRDWTFLGDRMQ